MTKSTVIGPQRHIARAPRRAGDGEDPEPGSGSGGQLRRPGRDQTPEIFTLPGWIRRRCAGDQLQEGPQPPRIRTLGVTGAAFMGAEGKDPAAGREGLTGSQGAQESRRRGRSGAGPGGSGGQLQTGIFVTGAFSRRR